MVSNLEILNYGTIFHYIYTQSKHTIKFINQLTFELQFEKSLNYVTYSFQFLIFYFFFFTFQFNDLLTYFKKNVSLFFFIDNLI